MAEKKLGLNIVHFDESKSSINKGRKSLDTIKNAGINWDKPFRNQTPKTRFYDELKGVKMEW